MHSVMILAPNKGYPFTEAWTNKVRVLSSLLKADVFATGKIDFFMQKKGNYVIFRRGILGSVALMLYAIIKQRKYSVIFIEERPDSKSGMVILFLLFLRIINPKKCCCEFSIDWKNEFKLSNILINTYIENIIPKFSAIIVMDKKTGEILAAKKGMDKKKIFIINGIDISKFGFKPVYVEDFRLLFASAPVNPKEDFFDVKGIILMLEALRKIRNKRIILTIVWRGAMFNELDNLVSEYGLEDRVKIIDEEVNMMDFYNQTHLTIFVPKKLVYSRNYPSSIMESLAAGKPVVVSNILEISQIITNENCGKVANPHAEDIAEKIMGAIDEYEILQKNCRSVAEKYFNITKQIKPLEELLWRK